MRSQRLFIIGLVLLLFLLISGCGGTNSGGGTGVSPSPTSGTFPTPPSTLPPPGGTPIPVPSSPPITPSHPPHGTGASATPSSVYPLIVNSTLSTLKIEADIPPMEVKHQVIIAIAIYPTGGNGAVSEVPVVKNATAIVTHATPVGTPGSTLVGAFGPNYSVIATATLETSPDIFSVAPTGPQPKPLDQERVEWDWFVTPLVDGEQSIGVDIEAQWTSTITGKQSLPYTLGFPKFPVHVQPLPIAIAPTPTPTPLPPPRPLDIFNALVPILTAIITALGGILAALFAVPSFRRWASTRFRKSKNRPPTEPQAPP